MQITITGTPAELATVEVAELLRSIQPQAAAAQLKVDAVRDSTPETEPESFKDLTARVKDAKAKVDAARAAVSHAVAEESKTIPVLVGPPDATAVVKAAIAFMNDDDESHDKAALKAIFAEHNVKHANTCPPEKAAAVIQSLAAV